MSIELITFLMFFSLILVIASGLPIAWCLGFVSVLFAFIVMGPNAFGLITTSVWAGMSNFLIIAVPLFIFMAFVLQSSGIVDDLYTLMHRWFGPIKGGLAMGTVLIAMLIAAMSGLSATGTLSLGVTALPSMLRRKYDPKLAMGCIMGGGALGILIPPSVPFVIYCLFSRVSVGRLFLAGILPGVMLTFLFIVYIAITCLLNPNAGPALSPAERVGWKEKFLSFKAVIMPILVVMAVLGSIFAGVASPTEAAALGVFGAIISSLVYRQLSWPKMKKAALETMEMTGMTMWICIAALCFTSVYTYIGGTDLISNTIKALEVSRWVVLIVMLVVVFILGCFLDPMGIMMITLPIYAPLLEILHFDLVWFGVMFTIGLETGYLTPPFGFNLFYMRGITSPKEIPMNTIWQAAYPFVGIQCTALILVMIFPEIALYLPNLVMGK